MLRALSVCALLLALPLAGYAADPPAPTETVIRLPVKPTAAPKPVLKYQLLPELKEMNPGNPLLAYLKCFMEQQNFYHNKEAVANREKWQTMPLKDLPLKEMQYYGSGTLAQADYAARLDTIDWQILIALKREGINLLLPEVQSLRMLAGALKVRFRIEVAEGRFDDAIATAKTMFALSRHLGEHPTLIGDLVGIAIAHIAFGPLEEMIEQPGSPNLFWALTDLPHPFIDLRKGLQGERAIMTKEFALIDDKAPMDDKQIRKVVDRLTELGLVIEKPEKSEKPARDLGQWLDLRVKDEDHVRAARARLVASGLSNDRVKSFPPIQVIFLDEKLTFEIARDEGTKGMSLPYWQAEQLLGKNAPPKESLETLLGGLIPATHKVRMAQARLEQRFALLTCVEGLRIYAAENDGKFPARLEDVKLPLPVDPVTGKSFVYKLTDGTATIQGTPPATMEKNAAYKVRYELTIAK
jgi:hypothetical protein